MSLLTNLIRLIPPTFRKDYCPSPDTWQQFANDLFQGARATILIQSGNFIYNYGPTTPTADNRIYPWLNTNNGLWWIFANGFWSTPHPIRPGPNGFRVIWTGLNDGSAGGLWKIDDGDGVDPGVTAPTINSGSFWQVDSVFAGRAPIGVGDVPGSVPLITTTVGTTIGEAAHVLTEAEGGLGAHKHFFGITNQDGGHTADDAFFSTSALFTGLPSWSGSFVTGGGSPVVQAFTQANLQTLAPGDDGLGVTAEAHSNIQPSIAVYFVKRTARALMTIPG